MVAAPGPIWGLISGLQVLCGAASAALGDIGVTPKPTAACAGAIAVAGSLRALKQEGRKDTLP